MQLMGSNSNMQQKSGTQPNWKDLADGIGIGMSVLGSYLQDCIVKNCRSMFDYGVTIVVVNNCT